MEETMRSGTSLARSAKTAVQNTAKPSPTLKLVLLWFAVSLPLLWGVLKALDDVQHLFE